MKSIVKTVASLALLVLTFSCALEKIDSQMTPEKARASIRLECSALESYTVQAAKPQDISFHVSATTPWTITAKDAAWLTVTPASSSVSSLSEDIIVEAAANTDFADRKAVLTVTGENTDKSFTITVTQLRKGKLVVTPVADQYEPAGGAKTFKVESNIAWEATAADEWLTLDPASGTSEGETKSFNVTATAAANSSVTRFTTVTVIAGDEKQEFDIIQKGQTLEFLPVADPAVDRHGATLELGVNATMDWKVECDHPAVTATKEGNDKVKVVVPWNNQFAPRTINVTVKPTTAAYGDVSSTVTLTQDINFSFSGHCEVLADGSVKVYGDQASRVKLIDALRYVNIIIKMGDKSFGENAQMWVYSNDAVEGTEIEIQNQIQLGKRVRVRLNGHLPNSGLSCYDSVDYDMSQSELNAMDEYRVDVVPGTNSTEGVQHLNFSFSYNGTLRSAVLDKPSIFADVPTAACHYWFGCYSASEDGTWYVVKTCDVISVEE